jgi:hypothetical protein
MNHRRPSLALLVLLALVLGFAPAPLPRRPRPELPPAIPDFCLMRWYSMTYRASFRSDGSYRAQFGNCALWVGRWRLDGRTLTIDEGTSPDPESWRRYVIEMRPDLRVGRFADQVGREAGFGIEPSNRAEEQDP